MAFQIMQVAMPKKAVERAATGSQYDVVRELPVGGAFFVPCNEGEDLNKCMRRVCGSCVRIAQDADVRLAFRSLDADTAFNTFGDGAKAWTFANEEDATKAKTLELLIQMTDIQADIDKANEGIEALRVFAPVAGVGVWRIEGAYNHRARKVAADEGEGNVQF